MSTKITVHVADATHVVHIGGEVMHKSFVVEVESEELEQLIKVANDPKNYTTFSLSVLLEGEK